MEVMSLSICLEKTYLQEHSLKLKYETRHHKREPMSGYSKHCKNNLKSLFTQTILLSFMFS